MAYRLVSLPEQGGAQPASAPGKKRYRLVAPPEEQTSNEAAKSDKGQSFMTKGEFTTDALKAVGAGAGRGIIGTLGLPGDLREIAATGGNMISPEVGQAVRQGIATAIPGFNAMTGVEMQQAVNDATRSAPNLSQVVTGEQPKAPLEYEGKSGFAQMAGRAAEFLPGVVAPGGAYRKAASVLLPAGAAEGAGTAFEGTPYEGVARTVGAVGGGLMSAGRAPNVIKELAKGAPAREAVKAATDGMYGALRKAGIKFDATAYDQFVGQLEQGLKAEGFRAAQAPKAADALAYMKEFVGKGLDYNDLESLRRTASKIKIAPDPTEQHFAGILTDALDTFAEKSPLISNGTVPANEVSGLMQAAREMASRNIKARKLEDAVEAAKTYQSGFESGIRNQFSNMARNPKKMAGFTAVEKDAIQRAGKGNLLSNTLGSAGRAGVDFGRLGNRALLGPGGAFGGGMLASGGNPVMGVATVAAATAAKYMARKMTQADANRAIAAMLMGKEKQAEAAMKALSKRDQLIVRRLIAGSNALGPLVPPINQGQPRLPAPVNE